jgi:hypothetical protein
MGGKVDDSDNAPVSFDEIVKKLGKHALAVAAQ